MKVSRKIHINFSWVWIPLPYGTARDYNTVYAKSESRQLFFLSSSPIKVQRRKMNNWIYQYTQPNNNKKISKGSSNVDQKLCKTTMKDAALMCSSLCLLKKTERSWLHSEGGREANRLPLTAWHGPQPPSTSSLGMLAHSSWLHPAVPAEAAQGCKWLYSQVRWMLKKICFSSDEVSVFWKVGSYRVPEFRVFKTETLSPPLAGKQQWETGKVALLERGKKKKKSWESNWKIQTW